MLNYFSPYDYSHESVDPYAAYIREQEVRRLNERRRRMQQQQQGRSMGRFHTRPYYCDDDLSEDDYEQDGPSYNLVRGRDGRIYRVPVNRVTPVAPPKKDPLYSIVRGRDGRLYRVPLDDDVDIVQTENSSPHLPRRTQKRQEQHDPFRRQQARVSNKERHQQLPDLPDLSEEAECVPTAHLKPRRAPKKSRSNHKKVTVIVEDASDSEAEEDARQSVWRNRLPSPGQWMEPVETILEL